jgi:hypothetical protein
MSGDIVRVPAYCLDLAVWKLGGAAVPMRLVQMANVRQLNIIRGLACLIGILPDGARAFALSWNTNRQPTK